VARAVAFDPSLARRRAAAVVPVTGGFAALDPRVRHSWEHNSLWLTGEVDAAALVADAEAVYGDRSRARAVLDRPPPPELEDLGWEVHEERVMVLGPEAPVTEPGPAPVVPVTSEVMGGLWRPTWRREVPGIGDEALDDLVRREPFIDAHLRLLDLAVLGDDGVPLAAAQLRIDGATAAVEAVMTDPQTQGKGLGTSVVVDAVRRAREAGCDLVHLLALTDDWPRHWYARLGFVDVGARWVALAPQAPS
jgi:GNAT superfamily N-acetyltransferase